MRGLMTAVIGMGVLILVGATVLVVLMVQRMSSAPHSNASAAAVPTASGLVVVDEPAGTRIAGMALAGERLAVQLAGGGPDRVVVMDARTGQIIARAALAR